MPPIKLPRWFSPIGVALHAIGGVAITVLFTVWPLIHCAPITIVFITALVAAVHEEAPRDDGTIFADFLRRFGGPGNGTLDVLAFFPAPLVWWAIA